MAQTRILELFSDAGEGDTAATSLPLWQLCQKLFISNPFESPFTTHLGRSGIWKSCSQTLQDF